MNEVAKKIKSEANKEAIKKWLKEQLTQPYDSEARKQETEADFSALLFLLL